MAPELLYVSFDIVPAPKGAAVHIQQYLRILADKYGSITLVSVADSSFSNSITAERRQLAEGIEQILLPAPGSNLLDRIMNFRRFLEIWIADKYFDLVHFRSPFEGSSLCKLKGKNFASAIFEVNGLPSIELKYRYPQLAEDTELLEKLLLQEKYCLDNADLIITPSKTTSQFLESRKVNPKKIRVIPNAVDLKTFTVAADRKIDAAEPLKLLYFGTLSPWQGVDTAVSALALINEVRAAQLKIIASARAEQIEKLLALAERLKINQFVSVQPSCSQERLVSEIHNSDLVLAPLSANDRNLSQGCCPFKVLETMASGRPLIASALPVVQEIAGDPPCVFLSKAGSAGSIKDTALEICADYDRAQELAKSARARIEACYTLERSADALLAIYEELLSSLANKAANLSLS